MNLDQLHMPALRQVLNELVLQTKLELNRMRLNQLIKDSIPKIHAVMRRGNQLLTENDVAALYPRLFDANKLRNLRTRGMGPRYIKFGNHKNSRVFYRLHAVEDWIIEHEQISTFLQGPDQTLDLDIALKADEPSRNSESHTAGSVKPRPALVKRPVA